MKNIFFCIISAISFLLSGCSKSGSDSSSTVNSTSTAGSLARFIIVGNYLYTISHQNLKSFNITDPANPVLESEQSIGQQIETIYGFKGNLFIGSSTDMYAYSLTNPGKPAKLSQLTYWVRGKDPVVANDTIAFSTVRNTTGSGGVLNIINIKNINSATLVNSIALQSPYGLGLIDTALYICEHMNGLKVYTLPTKSNGTPTYKKTISNSEIYYDVIPYNNLLYAYIAGGNCIFDITDRMNPVLLSKTKN